MSTTYEILKNGEIEIVLDERSGKFDIDLLMEEDRSYGSTTLACRLTPEQVVDLAMRLIQPTLYNVSDPTSFMEIIKAKLANLHI